jgi:hypothetical protein
MLYSIHDGRSRVCVGFIVTSERGELLCLRFQKLPPRPRPYPEIGQC